MHEIDMHKMSDAFFHCWKAAGIHLSNQIDGGLWSWLRAHPYPPFLEHFSFRLGNQLFFIRVEDVDGKVLGPGNPQGHITAAKIANGRACTLPMKKNNFDGTWIAEVPGWGLVDSQTGKAINPISLVSDHKIVMTQWEFQDMAVQIVRDDLEQQGFEMMSWHGDPEINPSMWFIGKTKLPEWVVVRPAIFPATEAERPSNWHEIAVSCARIGNVGHFASVSLASAEQPFISLDEQPLPLWRGHAIRVDYNGLE